MINCVSVKKNIYGCFQKIWGKPQNGWFIMENPIINPWMIWGYIAIYPSIFGVPSRHLAFQTQRSGAKIVAQHCTYGVLYHLPIPSWPWGWRLGVVWNSWKLLEVKGGGRYETVRNKKNNGMIKMTLWLFFFKERKGGGREIWWNTVDGRCPAPPDIYKTLQIIVKTRYQLMQGFLPSTSMVKKSTRLEPWHTFWTTMCFRGRFVAWHLMASKNVRCPQFSGAKISK